MFIKINPAKNGYFRAKIDILIQKIAENLRYIIVSDLFAILLLFRSLRYALSNNKNVYQNQPQGKW